MLGEEVNDKADPILMFGIILSAMMAAAYMAVGSPLALLHLAILLVGLAVLAL